MIVMDKVPGVPMNSPTICLGNAYDLEVKGTVDLAPSGAHLHTAS